MFSSLLELVVGEEIITREIASGTSRVVAFACVSDFGRQIYLPPFSEIKFKYPVYFRIYGGIRKIRTGPRAIVLKEQGSPCQWFLEFPGTVRIAYHLLMPNQIAEILRVPNRRTKCGLAPQAEELLFAA